MKCSRTVHGKEVLGAPQIQEYWTNFAKTSDPNDGKLVKWPRFDPTARAYMDFTDAGPVAEEGLRRQVCDFVHGESEAAGAVCLLALCGVF
jgi:carboxylesterase type B